MIFSSFLKIPATTSVFFPSSGFSLLIARLPCGIKFAGPNQQSATFKAQLV